MMISDSRLVIDGEKTNSWTKFGFKQFSCNDNMSFLAANSMKSFALLAGYVYVLMLTTAPCAAHCQLQGQLAHLTMLGPDI